MLSIATILLLIYLQQYLNTNNNFNNNTSNYYYYFLNLENKLIIFIIRLATELFLILLKQLNCSKISILPIILITSQQIMGRFDCINSAHKIVSIKKRTRFLVYDQLSQIGQLPCKAKTPCPLTRQLNARFR